jgi:hypothetical protein
MRRVLLFASLFLLPGISLPQNACLTTLPPDSPFTPPAPYDSMRAADGEFWYGTAALWTKLSVDGVWHTEHNVDRNGGYVTKLIFWSRAFDSRKEHEPQLILTAKRLDGDAPQIAQVAGVTVFVLGKPGIMIGVHIPTPGCWEVSTHYHETTVTL